MQNKEIYTTGEIAKLCGVNFQTVLRWIQKGELKAYQLPGRGDNRVKRVDFLHFLQEHNLPIPLELSRYTRRILIVDDDINLSKSLARTLNQEGFDTLISSDGFNAGIMAMTHLPALIILDLKMPGIGGFDILKLVRGLESLRGVKILVISGLSQAELKKALKVGADDFLEKPFNKEVFLGKVVELLAAN